MNNDDLFYDYIKQLENPNKVGWNEKLKRWEAPKGKGYDPNQRYYGLDVNTNQYVVKFFNDLAKQGKARIGKWLTDDEARMLQKKTMDEYFIPVFNRHTKGHVISPRKRAMALALLYHGHGNKLWKNNNDLYNAFWNGNDDDFMNAISTFYNGKNSERARQHTNYWKKYNTINKQVVSNSDPNIQYANPNVQYNLYTTPPTFMVQITINKRGGLIPRKLYL